MSGNLSGIGVGYSYAAATGGNYASTYQYDANGSLKTLTRRNSAGTLMDNFTYHYNANTNQLNYVADPAGSLGDDLDNQSADNYTYDVIGQLISDEQEEIEEIVWTVTGKVAEIRRKATSTKPDLFFTYDALGRRIRKEVRPRNGSGWVSIRDWVSTLYTYDGQGNVMAVYELKMRESGSTRTENYYISEINLYGSSRLGMIKDYRHIGGRTYSTSGPGGGAPPAMTYYSWDGVPKETRGDKFFELSNHLGNVLAVVTDRKLSVDDGLGTVAYYQPDVVSYSDYYPFGMLLDGRKGGVRLRNSFQGQEQDPEVKGDGNSINYKYRMHDPRLGRFFAVDPLAPEYPFYSPYSFSGNIVIGAVEIEGLEPKWVAEVNEWFDKNIVKPSQEWAESVRTNVDAATEPLRNKTKAINQAFNDNIVKPSQSVATSIRETVMGVTEPLRDYSQRLSDSYSEAMAVVDEIMRPYKQGRIEVLKDLYTILGSAGGSGMGSGLSVVGKVKEGLKLQKSITKVMGKGYKSAGEVTVPIKNTELLNKLNTTSKGDWVKVYEAGIQDGSKIETHYFRNNTTKQVFDVKTKYNYWHQKSFKKLGQ